MRITKRAALIWLAARQDAFTRAGFSVRIVGGVATHGVSAHDLDLLLTPLQPASLESQLNVFYSELRVSLDLVDVSETPMPCGTHDGVYFVGCTAGNGWLVEFYFNDPDN